MAHAPEVFQSKNQTVAALVGENLAAGDGVFGIGHGATGRGVVGTAEAQNGVTGVSATGTGVWGTGDSGTGVFGESKSASGVGVLGQNNVPGGRGVLGEADGGDAVFGASRLGRGVVGTSAAGTAVEGDSANGVGVWGASQLSEGVHGETNSDTFAAVAGFNRSQIGTGAGIFGAAVSASGFAGFFSGNVEITGNLVVDGDICLPGAGDLAESFAMGEPGIEPGTVVVITGEDTVIPCRADYDPLVAGVVSGAGRLRSGVILSRRDPSRCTLAVAGRTYCKVDAGYAPIGVGDLLTSSPTPGHAMKALDAARLPGTVIGKALRAIGGGTDVIPILVALG
jgi:hypothetical protein